MPRVNTVLGPIPTEELGLVAVHEHIGYGMPGSELDTRWWKTPEERYDETVPKLRQFHEYGGGTFVDATGICNGRDVNYYQSLSEKTGVHIVASTGFVGGDTALPFFARATVDYLAAHFTHEITVGIGNTGGKAGIIKVGVSRGGRMTDLDKRIYRAAARAALATGVPVLTHLAIDAENAIAIFTEEGLPLDRVLFGHVDDGVNADKTRDTWIADQGGRIGFDTFGYETELPDPPFWARPRKERLEHFLRFIGEGRLHQVLASADANCSPLGWPGVEGHTVNYIFEDLIPDLRAAGLDEAAIRTIFVDNPASFLSIAN
ncbi:phosphotriesterase [Intrasporangium calvum]|uniref:Phosphotriesterase n=1 Tax=Intrasporangium calvum TaxID=53358 RepID=A0ABT5GIK5_9MICO|nr:phosphotriesterase [Intrasporangium calvum]MDC5698083.1 phosphotriesterase [Intrasporangium calvum]